MRTNTIYIIKNSTSLDNNLSSKNTCNIDSYTTNLCRQSIINSQEVNIDEIEKQIHNWSIPCMRTNTIYLRGKFQLNQTYVIQTKEQTISLNQNLESL